MFFRVLVNKKRIAGSYFLCFYLLLLLACQRQSRAPFSALAEPNAGVGTVQTAPQPRVDGQIVGNGALLIRESYEEGRSANLTMVERIHSLVSDPNSRKSTSSIEGTEDLYDPQFPWTGLVQALKRKFVWDQWPEQCPKNSCGCTLTNDLGHTYYNPNNCKVEASELEKRRVILHEALHGVVDHEPFYKNKKVKDSESLVQKLTSSFFSIAHATNQIGRMKWLRLSPGHSPKPRSGDRRYPSSVGWTGESLGVWDPYDPNQVYLYDPGKDKWSNILFSDNDTGDLQGAIQEEKIEFKGGVFIGEKFIRVIISRSIEIILTVHITVVDTKTGSVKTRLSQMMGRGPFDISAGNTNDIVVWSCDSATGVLINPNNLALSYLPQIAVRVPTNHATLWLDGQFVVWWGNLSKCDGSNNFAGISYDSAKHKWSYLPCSPAIPNFIPTRMAVAAFGKKIAVYGEVDPGTTLLEPTSAAGLYDLYYGTWESLPNSNHGLTIEESPKLVASASKTKLIVHGQDTRTFDFIRNEWNAIDRAFEPFGAGLFYVGSTGSEMIFWDRIENRGAILLP